MQLQQHFFYGKNEKLKSRKEISGLFLSGKKINRAPFRVFYTFFPGTGTVKAGVGVSSRNFKRAVDRNRIKRLMRESYRLNKNHLTCSPKNNLNLFILYNSSTIHSFEEMFVSMKKILESIKCPD